MPFQFEQYDDDRALLVSFLNQLEAFLKTMTWEPRTYVPDLVYFPGAEPTLREMWDDVPGRFDQARNAAQAVSIERLADAGLTGVHLRGKMAFVQHWAGRLINSPLVVFLRKLLEILNKILESFVKATGVGELIKEFKDLVESAIDDIG